ncbi:MAG: CDP-glycerol glycerophosphotransferase family protein [Parachlamydiaceae bacterium]
MNQSPAGIVLNPTAQMQYIDHLAPIATIMQAPFCFLDEECFELGKRYYPGLQAHYIDFVEFSLEKMIEQYDFSLMSDLWDEKTEAMFTFLSDKYNKTWRNVHCPHGFSDKAFYLTKCFKEDIVLVYGKNMIDQFRTYGVWDEMNTYILSGNYRYTYFKQHRDFYDKIFQEEIQSHFDAVRPIILYAPTWVDAESSGCYFEAYQDILDHLPPDYNLIVKLHPLLEMNDVAQYYRIIGKYEKQKNILFLTKFPPVFPLLAHTNIYIGDMSSIGYDYLAFDKPLFLLNGHNRDSKTDLGLLLFKCATEIKPDQFKEIYRIIEKSLPKDKETFSNLRKEMWNYTFGEERSLVDLRNDILKACE